MNFISYFFYTQPVFDVVEPVVEPQKQIEPRIRVHWTKSKILQQVVRKNRHQKRRFWDGN